VDLSDQALAAEDQPRTAWDMHHLRLAIEAAGVTLWSWNVDTDELTMDGRAFDLWGLPRSETVTFEDLSAHIHPADRDRVRAAFAATRAIVGPYEIDFRILVGDDVRWISARGDRIMALMSAAGPKRNLTPVGS
jgi:PAS domain-containing protein